MKAPPPSEAETKFVHTQLLTLVASQSRTVLIGVLAASSVLAAMVSQPTSIERWGGWLILVLAGQMIRIKVQYIAPHETWLNTSSAQLKSKIRQGIAVAALCGSIQALCLLGFPYINDSYRTLITLIILGLTTGAISNSAGHRPTYLAYCIPLIFPLVFSWIWCSGNSYSVQMGWSISGLILICISAILMGYAKTAWQLFDESCRMRFRESDLNARLVNALSRAEQSSSAKTRFLAAASHDLRQPLHAISLIGAALKLRQLDARSDEMVTLLNQVSASLSTQLDSLLDISKLDAGVVEVNLQTLSAAQLLDQFFAEFSPLVRAKGLSPVLDIQSHACVKTDPTLLVRILTNLSQNALKFTPQGAITLTTFEQGNLLVIAITDTGCGIEENNHEEIFQEFYQLHNSERNPANGLGLGLSIVRRTTALLGIRLELSSALGRGTTVRLCLPIADQPSGLDTWKSQSQPPENGERFNHTVLVIDDEATVRRATYLLLTELGCTCLLAEDLNSARQCVASVRPNLIISDLRLRNHENGIEVIAALRHEFGNVPALLISGDTAPERLQIAKQAGLRLCHKPLSLADLAFELRQITFNTTHKNLNATT